MNDYTVIINAIPAARVVINATDYEEAKQKAIEEYLKGVEEYLRGITTPHTSVSFNVVKKRTTRKGSYFALSPNEIWFG